MRRTPSHIVALAVALAVLLAAPASAAKKPTRSSTKTVVTRGLATVLQDDGNFLFRPAPEVRAAAARAKALGVDTIRLTAGWSSLTRGADDPAKPVDFDARDPAAYEQERWRGLDTAVRAVREAGLTPLIDIGFWAPTWATTDPGPRARENIDPQAFADYAVAVVRRYSGTFAVPPDPSQAPPPASSEDESLLSSILTPELPFPLPDPFPPPTARGPARAAQSGEGGAAGPGEPLPHVDQLILWNEPNHQGLLLPQWKADATTPASPSVYRAMVRAAYGAIKSISSANRVLIGNTSSTGGTRGSGPVPPLEFLREFACVDRSLKPRTTGDCAGFTTIPGDGWAHHPYSQNERPSRTSRPERELDDLRLADLPLLSKTLNALVRMGRLTASNRNIYLTEFGYETQPVKGRPTIGETTQARWLTWAEYLADRVPRVRSFAQFLLRDQPPAPVRVSASDARAFGQYSTGLLVADGRDKVAAKSFVAGLFAQRWGKTRVTLYGRLRLGAGRKSITIQRKRSKGSWQTIGKLKVDGRSAFTQTVRYQRGARYRLGFPAPAGRRAAGVAVAPKAAAR